jgi:hypothetical protein
MSADASHHGRKNGQTHAARHDLIRSLDDLALLTAQELRGVYAGGSVPASLVALDGELAGRMLAIRRLRRGRLFRALAAIAKSSLFPWSGKRFASSDGERGKGENRVRLAGTRHAAPFSTRYGISAIDGHPCIVLDYRGAIHDELREVGPGIFLGPACLKRPGRAPIALVWFGLHRS